MGDAIVVTGRTGKITWTNPAFTDLCGYSAEEVYGKKPGSFLQGKETDPETVRELREAVRHGKVHHTEIINYHKKGHHYWVGISLTPLHTGEGKLDGFVAVERDVTAMRKRIASLEEQLVEVYSALIAAVDPNPDETAGKDPFHAYFRHHNRGAKEK